MAKTGFLMTWLIFHWSKILVQPTWQWAREPPHDKTNNMTVRPAKTQIGLGIRPVWSESLLSAWRNLGSLATHWAHSEDFDQTGRTPRLIWVFAGRTVISLVLSRGGSFVSGLACKTTCAPNKQPTQISLCIQAVWTDPSFGAQSQSLC